MFFIIHTIALKVMPNDFVLHVVSVIVCGVCVFTNGWPPQLWGF